MSLELTRYYIFKETTKYISANIKSSIDVNAHLLFKYALFQDISNYYHLMNPLKKDHFQLSHHIFYQNFKPFFFDCIEQAYFHSNEEEMLFCYYLLFSYVILQETTPYIRHQVTKRKSALYIQKTMDAYMFRKNEGILLSKMNLADYFFDSYQLSEHDIHLIEKPIKRNYGFFRVQNYYKTCYEGVHYYFNHLCRSKFGGKRILFTFYDVFLNHRKGKPKATKFFYPRKIDTTILNLSKTSYVHDDKMKDFDMNELMEECVRKTKSACYALNDYFNFKQNKKNLENIIDAYEHVKIHA